MKGKYFLDRTWDSPRSAESLYFEDIGNYIEVISIPIEFYMRVSYDEFKWDPIQYEYWSNLSFKVRSYGWTFES